jgi:hypothetical protein
MPTVPALDLTARRGIDPVKTGDLAARRPPSRGPNDRLIRLVGIPFLGFVIPSLTGFFGTLGPRSPLYWLGHLWGVLISALLWEGNRFLILQQRRRYDWLDHRWRKAALLLLVNVAYTAPVTVGMMWAWFRIAGLEMDWGVTRAVLLSCLVSVVSITHAYETVYLIKQRERDAVAVARLEQARAEAELLALKSQVDPHFLFNSLHGLTQLIPREPAQAVRFAQGLGDVYRYILTQRERDFVLLTDEMAFARIYVDLLRLRFGDAVRLVTEGLVDLDTYHLPPVSLQVLLENAVKHNAIDERSPLAIRIALADGRLTVSNPMRRGKPQAPSVGVGLRNLQERYRRVVGEAPEVLLESGRFSVILPLVASRR